MEEERPSKWNRFKSQLRENLLTILLVTSVLSGCVFGILIRSTTEPLEENYASYIGFPGDVLIRMLKCSATPLILACIIVALGSLDLKVSRTICWQLIVLVFSTKVISSLVGLTAVLAIQPGRVSAEPSEHEWQAEQGTIVDIFLDMFRNIFTGNMVRMFVQQCQTKLLPPEKNATVTESMKWEAEIQYINSTNMLGLIFVAIIVGLSLAILESEGKGLYHVAENVYFVSMKVATWVLWMSPGFIFFLILAEIMKIKDFYAFAKLWGMYLLATHVGFVFVFVVEYPLIVFIFTRENPYKFIMDIGSALITAYATSSSIGTMPILIESLEKHGLDPRLVKFVVPIAININKDGAACFLTTATIFVAQMEDVSLSWGHYLTALVLAAMGSVAAASVPFSAIVVLIMILNGLGLSQNWIGGILAVEWINDRASTLCNVFGNSCLTKILAKWNKKYLEEHQKDMSGD